MTVTSTGNIFIFVIKVISSVADFPGVLYIHISLSSSSLPNLMYLRIYVCSVDIFRIRPLFIALYI